MTRPPDSAGPVARVAARGAAIRGVAEVASKAATLVWTIAAARGLPPNDFGVVSFGLAAMLLMSAFPAWGFDEGLMRRGAARPEQLDRTYSSVQWWKTALAVPTLVITGTLVLPGQTDASARWVIVLMLLAVLPELWSKSVRAASSARQRPTEASQALVLQRLVTAALIVAALGAGLGMMGVAAAFLAGTLAGAVAHEVAVRRIGVRPGLGPPRRVDLGRAVRGTWLIGLNGLMMMTIVRVDTVMLEAMQGMESVAVYTLAYRLLETVLFVAYAVNQAVFPVLSATQDPVRWRKGYERSLSVGAFVYLPFAAVCVIESGQVVAVLFGDRYSADAGEVLVWLAPSAVLFAIGFFASTLLMAVQRPRSMVVASAAACVVNVLLNLLLIPGLSGVGAALATTIAYAVQALVMVVAIRRIGVTPRLWRPLAPALVASVVLVGVLWLLPWPVLLELTGGGVVYLATWVLASSRLDPMQRQVLLDVLRRRR